MQLRLEQYGKVEALVGGHFGEISLEFDALLQQAAEVGADRSWASMLVSSAAQAKGALMWQIRRRIGSALERASFNLMSDRIALMAAGSVQAQCRRARSRARFFTAGIPSNCAYEYGLSRAAHSSGWTGRVDP